MASGSRPFRLRDIARQLGRETSGDGEFEVRGVASLESAGSGDLAFVRSTRHAPSLDATAAGAVIVPPGLDAGGRPAIVSPNPALDFARAVDLVVVQRGGWQGVHPSASLAPGASVDPSASVNANAVVGEGSRIGAGTVLHANVTVYPDVEVGADCVFHSGVIVREGSRIGDRVILQPGVVIGGDGFGYVHDERGAFRKVPQVGRVVIEDDVEIGAGTTVDRATLDETRIRRGAKIDNLVQIAHNCDVGEGVIIIAQTGLSGSTVVGRGALVMAQAGSAGHLRIGERAFVGARAGLHKDVPDGARVWGTPQMEERGWHRSVAALARLPHALARLRAVERALGLRGGREGSEGQGEEEDARGQKAGPES